MFFGKRIARLLPSILFFFAVVICVPAEAANVDIVTGNGITNRDVTNAVHAVELTGQYMYQNFQRSLMTDVSLKLVSADDEAPANSSGSFSTNGRIVITIKESSNDYRTIFLVAHELVHQYQQDIASPDTLNKNMWFTEGMADYFAMKIANQTGNDRTAAFLRHGERARGLAVSLKDIAPRRQWVLKSQEVNLYPLADLAAIRLAQRFPENSFFAYILSLNTHSAEEAMRLTYGIGMDDIIDIPSD